MITSEQREKLRGWLAGRVPDDLFEELTEVTVDREEITVIGRIPAPHLGEDVSAAVRKVKHKGITGEIEFDSKGDRQKALYFVLQVASENPEKWGDNKIVKQLTIAAPSVKK